MSRSKLDRSWNPIGSRNREVARNYWSGRFITVIGSFLESDPDLLPNITAHNQSLVNPCKLNVLWKCMLLMYASVQIPAAHRNMCDCVVPGDFHILFLQTIMWYLLTGHFHFPKPERVICNFLIYHFHINDKRFTWLLPLCAWSGVLICIFYITSIRMCINSFCQCHHRPAYFTMEYWSLDVWSFAAWSDCDLKAPSWLILSPRKSLEIVLYQPTIITSTILSPQMN